MAIFLFYFTITLVVSFILRYLKNESIDNWFWIDALVLLLFIGWLTFTMVILTTKKSRFLRDFLL